MNPAPTSIFAPGVRSASIGASALIALLALEYIAVAAAMPTIAEALDGYHLYNLAFGATVAASVIGMVIGGWWSDRSSPRPVVLAGATIFILGLVVAGLAGSMYVFAVGRALQGLGSGLSNVAIYVVIAQRVPDDLRPAVFSLLAAAWVVPGLVGPVLTGTMVAYLSWRWVFLGVVPLVLLALVVLWPALRSTHAAGEAGYLRPAIIAWAIVAALSVGILNLSGDSVERREMIIGAVVLVLLIIASWRLLPTGTLLLARGLPAVMGVRAVIGGSFIAAEAYLPLLLQDQHGYTPAGAGAVLAVAAIAWAFGSWIQGRLGPATDRYRVMILGSSFFAVCMVLLAVVVWYDLPGWVVISTYGVATLGVGLAYPTSSLLTMRLSPAGEIGRNSSALQMGEALASAFTLAITGVVFSFWYYTDAHLAFVGTLTVAFVVALFAMVAAGRARPVGGAR